MARTARRRSETGIYHVMLKGIDGRSIFLDDEDKDKFIEIIINVKEAYRFALYGYCLMDNHVHLLIQELDEYIGTTIKRITVSYVHWHNNKYGRTGHLYQNRFNSEVVETEGYFKTVLRYIHRNPINAGMISKLEDYHWSSYNQYLKDFDEMGTYIDTDFVKDYFPDKLGFIDFMKTANTDNCLEYENKSRYTDSGLRTLIREQFKVDELLLKELPNHRRNMIIRELYYKTGVSMRQLGRVLGVSKGIIELAIKSEDKFQDKNLHQLKEIQSK